MAKSSGTLDKWRDYFRTANSDIFDIIEYAVMVAAVDCPKEFKIRRDKIAEMLFTCKVTKCFGCEKVELALPIAAAANDDEGKHKSKNEFGGSKESKANSSIDMDHHDVEVNVNQVSNYSYGEAEALTEEIEEETQTFGEVMRIKDIIDNKQAESAELFECLRRLQLMALSVETLKATEIGKSVNSLRKHNSKDVRHLSRTLIEDWKILVDEWVNSTAAFTGTESTPESKKASVVDQEEEGLPSPPLDDLAFFSSQTSIELSQFFDGMDDDGNPRNSGGFNENRGNGRKPSLGNQNIPVQKQQSADCFDASPKERRGEQQRKQEAVIKKQTVAEPNRPSRGESGPGRPIKPALEQKHKINDMNFQQKSDKGTIQKRPVPMPSQQNKLRCSDEDPVKLEATKRKLQERYQEAENAKRQRTIQVMELHDLPKKVMGPNQGLGLKNAHFRPGNNNRHWANGRR